MNPRAHIILDYMNKNLHLQLTVDALAQRAGLSRSGFTHLFARELGLPAMRYLKLLRMQRASALLESSLLIIKEIAVEVGYQDGPHFMRDFKKTYGMTPSDYRTHHVLGAVHAEYADATDSQSASPST